MTPTGRIHGEMLSGACGRGAGTRRAGEKSYGQWVTMPKYLFTASLSPEGVAGVLAEGGTARRTTVADATARFRRQRLLGNLAVYLTRITHRPDGHRKDG